MRRALPTAWVVEDELPNLALANGGWMPQSCTHEAVPRLHMDVERRRLDLPRTLVEQLGSLPRLVRRFVVRVTGVPLDAEQ